MTIELVNVTVDGREVQVPKGTGMVETALAAGVEIPIFCYEPRLGAPVGACRMCLCEVEGMPKLQAACTLTAQDGMVLRSALASEKAAAGQNAVLEFILLNHPLDCPDCDKGGECPLQDHTFRYGPPATRMQFMKRTFDKPIPISPLIALDRERCILCYRCTRFSEEVAEDGQLVTLNRGASSFIATFESEPYRAHFSGNVTELCPVGALLPTPYRFRARPWEIQNVPTVCGLCPVGCPTSVTTREGAVARVLSRNHPEVNEGWLCDKGRFAFGHLQATDRIRSCGPLASGSGRLLSTTRSQRRQKISAARARPSSSRSPDRRPMRSRLRSRASFSKGSAAGSRSCRTILIPPSEPSARRSRRSGRPTSASSSATTRWSSARRSSISGSARPAARAQR
jgi:NADH-quinone oxidoreductase subunit G